MGPCDPLKGTEFKDSSVNLSEAVTNILSVISSNFANTVAIISGRGRNHMKKKFGHIQNIFIVAENGYYYSWSALKPIEFHKLMDIKDWGWKDTVLDIIKSYQERTDGSIISVKDASIRLYFKDVDADFAIKESNELVAHLHTILEYLPLDIVHLKDYVEVKPAGVDKGGFTKELLKMVTKRKGPIDFILCIGDSETDELMFKEIKEFSQQSSLEENVFCVTLEQKMSEAKYYVNDYQEVITALEDIVLPCEQVYTRMIYSLKCLK